MSITLYYTLDTKLYCVLLRIDVYLCLQKIREWYLSIVDVHILYVVCVCDVYIQEFKCVQIISYIL